MREGKPAFIVRLCRRHGHEITVLALAAAVMSQLALIHASAWQLPASGAEAAAAGSLDPSFGTGGRVFVEFPEESAADAFAFQPDGRMILAGVEGPNVKFGGGSGQDFALARLNTDGSLDTSFGTAGLVTTDISSGDRAFSVALQADGKIVAAGLCNDFSSGGKFKFAIVRYNTDGSLDTGFGTGGKVITAFPFDAYAFDAVIQPDQKIVAAGYVSSSNQVASYVLVRYNTDGSLDTSFGVNGIATTAFSGGSGQIAKAVLLQPDQKIVAAGGNGGNAPSLARYNPDGSLDPSFGTGGQTVRTDPPAGDANAIKLLADGKFLTAGNIGSGNYLLIRYNSDGSTDTTFGFDGFVTTDFGEFDTAKSIALQSDQKIVAGGGTTSGWTMARYNPDGSLDSSFGTGGKVKLDMASGTLFFQQATNVGIQSDGNIVASGRAYLGSKATMGVARFVGAGTVPTPTPTPTPTPSPTATPTPTPATTPLPPPNSAEPLDYSFGSGGKVIVPFDLPNYAASVVIQANGRVVLGGTVGSGGQSDFALARLNTNGSLDNSFGVGGRVTTDLSAGDAINAIALQPDGRVVAAGITNLLQGSSTDLEKADFGLARYNPDGSLDNSFGTGGKVRTDLFGGYDSANAIALQADGKIVVAGQVSTSFSPGFYSFGLARYNADGSLDQSFGNGGKVRTTFNNTDSANAVALLADGRIIVAGGGACDFALVRYNADGSLDSTFGTGGKVTTELGFNFCDEANAIAIQTDGRIVAAGVTGRLFALVRYLPDGALDNSFGGDGIVTTEITNRDASAASMIIQADGKVIAAGTAAPPFEPPGQPPATFALTRYNSDGTLDSTFGSGGVILTGFETFGAGVLAMALQTDGRIVVTGTRFAVARYLPNNATQALVEFTSDVYPITESCTALDVTLVRTGLIGEPVDVNYVTSDGTASQRSDYTFASGVVRFAAGETSRTISILISDDAIAEGTETASVELTGASANAGFGARRRTTIQINDNDPVNGPNPIDAADIFVSQHYHDFLNREADASGRQFWTNEITSCGSDARCIELKRVNVSAAFFLSIEFQETGFFVLRTQRTAFGRRANIAALRFAYESFVRDSRQVSDGVIQGAPGADQLLENNKQSYAQQIVNSAAFAASYPATQTAAQYVDALYAAAGVAGTSTEKQDAVAAFGAGGTAGRVAALRKVADSNSVRSAEFNAAFVLMQYYGYLRRNPTDPPDTSDDGYQFWLTKLNNFGGNFVQAEMVKAFIASSEYRQRFGLN